jgi:hypothetical protein
MNATLPRTPLAARFQAVFAAAAVTLAMFSAIDRLASGESAAALMAQMPSAHRT